MRDKLNSIKEEALKQIQSSDALEKLNDVRVAFLGNKGELTAVLKSMGPRVANIAPPVG